MAEFRWVGRYARVFSTYEIRRISANAAKAEDELRVISKQLTRLSFRAQPLLSDK
jgi:hypothetical protein